MKLGKIVGVGVGPGDPELMTLKAVRVLRTVDVVAIPRKDRFSQSVAWRIARGPVGEVEGQERLFLEFPMTKNPEILRPAWEQAMDQIGERLQAGRDVAFITEGDPFVYSTFVYLQELALQRWPSIALDVVPAVSSISAVPAVTGVPLADGRESVAILPASYGTDDLVELLQRFDTVVLMKVGSVMPQVVAALEEVGLLDRAVYVSRATMEGERIVRDVASVRNDRCDYFSMVVVASRRHSGVLTGKLSPESASGFAGGAVAGG